MNPHQRLTQHLIVFLIILAFLAHGCGKTPDGESSDDGDFDGEWKISETYTGCDASGADNLSIDIDQNGSSALLTIEDQSLSCRLSGATLKCAGIFNYDDGSYQEYTDLNLRIAATDALEGEAEWTYYNSEGLVCTGTSVISGQSVDAGRFASLEEGAVKIKNNTADSFELINIAPCEVSSWGPNQMFNDDLLDPEEIYQINGLPAGCYSIRACRDSNVDDDTECITYNAYVEVEVGTVSSVSLEFK
jgi:hypothetical protein